MAVNEVVESIKPSTLTAGGGDSETESEGEEKDQADKKVAVVNQPKDVVTKGQDGKDDDVNKPKDASRGYRGAFSNCIFRLVYKYSFFVSLIFLLTF